jgi:hypothetical protein
VVGITGIRENSPTLVAGRIIWGKDGENDRFEPFQVGLDLRLPEQEGRRFKPPSNIDQTKLSRMVIGGVGQFDEIRVGPTDESVIGAGGEAVPECSKIPGPPTWRRIQHDRKDPSGFG